MSPRTWIVGTRKITLVDGSITDLSVDAVVTAANPELRGGGGVDGAVHRAAGPALLRACREIQADASGQRCPVGQARITPGFRLAPWVIHAVGPVWDPTRVNRSEALLASAFQAAFFLAEIRECKTLAMPAISTGVYGFPMAAAAEVAVTNVLQVLERALTVQEVVFALQGDEAFLAFQVAIERWLDRPVA